MKTAYAATFGAFRLQNNKYSAGYKVMSLVADATKDAVEQYALGLAIQHYPTNQGYYGHYSSVAEFTPEQINDILEAHS